MATDSKYGLRQRAGLIGGPLILLLFLVTSPPDGLSVEAWHTAGVGLLMAAFWVSEAIPVPVTALIPLVAFPILGISDTSTTAAPYAHKLVFLFLGGFLLSLAMQRCNLHRRIALLILHQTGTRPGRIIAGFMLATAFLSMWVSNTATVMMMFPIATSILATLEHELKGEAKDHHNFALCLMLAIAYAANIGGVGTPIGTPPNTLLLGFLSENYGYEIGFGQWMLFGVPVVAVFLPLTFFLLTRILFRFRAEREPKVRALIDSQLQSLGPLRRSEIIVASIASCMALGWVVRPYIPIEGLDDTVIAMAGAIAFFLIPIRLDKGEFIMNWEEARKIPWGILLLFGGGLSLASTIKATGLAAWIGNSAGALQGLPIFALLMIVCFVMVFLTEMTSNTATTAAFLPILAAVAVGMALNPLILLVPIAVCASCAFMLPVATPPNAIIFASGRVSLPEMARAGFGLNLLSFTLIPTLLYLVGFAVFDIDLGVFPDWAR